MTPVTDENSVTDHQQQQQQRRPAVRPKPVIACKPQPRRPVVNRQDGSSDRVDTTPVEHSTAVSPSSSHSDVTADRRSKSWTRASWVTSAPRPGNTGHTYNDASPAELDTSPASTGEPIRDADDDRPLPPTRRHKQRRSTGTTIAITSALTN